MDTEKPAVEEKTKVKAKPRTVSIVIPAHNEEKRIGPTLEAYGKFFSARKKTEKLDYQIIVVINNTKDSTPEIVKKWSKKYKKIKTLNFVQGGKGFALIEGFKESLQNKKNELIGFVDADMATTPEAFYDLIVNLGNDDGIIASRYIPGAYVEPKQSFQRIFVSRIFNLLIRTLFFMPYRDTQCGAKLFTRRAIESIIDDLSLSLWAFDVDLLYNVRKKGFRVREFPTVWSDKAYSTINFSKAGPRMALSIIRLRIINSPFKDFIKVYNKMPEWMKIHHAIRN
ncbi:MAG: glycosyltransferase [Candidatus Pacearchaeota archaeon]|jgi:glycosyltransferase involved in cell wall biosynthesis